MADALLEVRDLRTYFDTDRGLFRAVDGVELRSVAPRPRRWDIVGESGCGKSGDLAVDHAAWCPVRPAG